MLDDIACTLAILHRPDVQLAKEIALSLLGQLKAFIVDKASVIGVLDHLCFNEDVAVAIELGTDTHQSPMVVIEELQVVPAYIVVGIVDKKMAEDNEQHLVFLILGKGADLTDELQFLVHVKELTDFPHKMGE